MSVYGLHVDTCDNNSHAKEISKCIRGRDSLITLLMCLRALGIHTPREIRRLLALYCTEPALTLMADITPHQYYAHYLSHAATRKYNPILHCVSDTADAVFLMVHVESANSNLTTFYHPHYDLLRGRVATAGTNWIRNRPRGAPAIIELDDRPIQYQYPLPRYGDIVIGVEYDPRILSIKITTGGGASMGPYTVCKLTAQELNIRSFNIPSDSPVENETPEMFRDRIAAAYRPKYNAILSFDKFLQPRHDTQYLVIVETRGGIDALGLVHLFLPSGLLFDQRI